MAISFNKALGIHQYTIGIRERNTELISNNIAQANTPGFKAQGMDFQKALSMVESGKNVSLSRTDSRHLFSSSTVLEQHLYRIPNQPDTGDGNTVDVDLERNLFMQNQIRHQASLDFLGSKFKNLLKAIKGE
ncbi:flagellar basal-body rod protein flgB [Candidatus Photodesmus blepharus]|uniref:Flagellar basal body rod protein FlgB n=1 Tax=Candidatus Photodesmus blepharonis TaxID=1179155 RepID=A0A084CMF2_9GAMM|nr:flagellar basal body rod protein FlgB [Candidatus Photodesmus blepharus]KEY90981.1 flagellar basal-body rod protein flgB [Candidatus Photodesmus blepharus]